MLQVENQQLRAENEKFRLSVFHHSVNWRVLPDGSEDGPFCPVCHAEGVDMRLTPREVDQTGEVWSMRCPLPHIAGVGSEGTLGRGKGAILRSTQEPRSAGSLYSQATLKCRF